MKLFFKKYMAVLIFSVILVLGIAGCFFVLNIHIDEPVAKIYSDGVLVREIHLNSAKSQTFTVESNNGYNVVSVENGGISVTEASCPDHVCINQGVITDGVTPIVCLPNKLVIKIENSENNETDAVSG